MQALHEQLVEVAHGRLTAGMQGTVDDLQPSELGTLVLERLEISQRVVGETRDHAGDASHASTSDASRATRGCGQPRHQRSQACVASSVAMVIGYEGWRPQREGWAVLR